MNYLLLGIAYLPTLLFEMRPGVLACLKVMILIGGVRETLFNCVSVSVSMYEYLGLVRVSPTVVYL